ncbi:hypothetical protein Rhopal_000789-T1 [Rhodotorula paludigena]|uniref:t-SNARE coiled-coil homology domain-containing protein n=1 Tax=Rhodotorula paludigena TaxID=86838 RepID=A0AAV5GBM2_9BASI|nr:hypothetical protein Rhopal_000789-T1 [Rhodotorula paludigena]
MYNRPSDRYAADRTAEDIEGQNDEALEGLSQKVKLLKNITINIGNEVRDSTKMLNGMNDTFGETGNFLGGTMKKMQKMARRQGGQWCLWMVFLGIVATVFFWTWLWRRLQSIDLSDTLFPPAASGTYACDISDYAHEHVGGIHAYGYSVSISCRETVTGPKHPRLRELETERQQLLKQIESLRIALGRAEGEACNERELRTARTHSAAETFAGLIDCALPHDVCIDFPRWGRQIWSNEANASPYFKDLFSSGFGEAISVAANEHSVAEPADDHPPYSFEESDDETDSFFFPRSAAPAAKHPIPVKKITVVDTAYATYRVVLIWLRTEHIDFAPLISSFRTAGDLPDVAVAARLKKLGAVDDETDDASSPAARLLCAASPKSVYRLADLLSLEELKALALDNLVTQLTSANAAYELYTDVATCNAPVRDAVLAYVVENWDTVKTAAATQEMERLAREGELPKEALGTAMLLAKRLADRQTEQMNALCDQEYILRTLRSIFGLTQ